MKPYASYDGADRVKAIQVAQNASCFRFARELTQPSQYNRTSVVARRKEVIQSLPMLAIQSFG